MKIGVKSDFLSDIYKKIPDYDDDWFFDLDEKYDLEEDNEENEIENDYECDKEDKKQDQFKDDEYEFSLRGFDFEKRVLLDLDYLEDHYIFTNDLGYYYFNLKDYQSIVIFMMDGNERYGYEGERLLYYMMDLFGPMKGYESQEQDDEILLGNILNTEKLLV